MNLRLQQVLCDGSKLIAHIAADKIFAKVVCVSYGENVMTCLLMVFSMSGHRMIGADNTVYSASKFAVRAITEGHRLELRKAKSNIRVTVR